MLDTGVFEYGAIQTGGLLGCCTFFVDFSLQLLLPQNKYLPLLTLGIKYLTKQMRTWKHHCANKTALMES